MNVAYLNAIRWLSTKLFNKSKPMSGLEYEILSSLVSKNAKKKSTIPGMK